MTSNEKKVQAGIRKRAKEEREKDSKVKFGCRKLHINGKWVKWKGSASKVEI
jgi:hypothetical protein